MAGPIRAAPAVPSAPRRGRRPVTADSAASVTAGAYAVSSHEPTLIGEVGLKTRSMLTKRSGRPRSWTSSTAASVTPPAAPILPTRASAGRSVKCAPAASTDELPASPPTNRYPAMSLAFHRGALRTGLP
jgi:hypothetical protein